VEHYCYLRNLRRVGFSFETKNFSEQELQILSFIDQEFVRLQNEQLDKKK